MDWDEVTADGILQLREIRSSCLCAVIVFRGKNLRYFCASQFVFLHMSLKDRNLLHLYNLRLS